MIKDSSDKEKQVAQGKPLKIILIASVTFLVLIGSVISGFQLTGKDSPTGEGDVLAENRVMSQDEYDSIYDNESYTFDGFVYTDALNLQLRFQSNEELENFTNELKPLQNEEVSSKLKDKFTGEHIVYKDRKISTKEFTELHKENRAVWVKCYLPKELLTSDIKAFDSKEQFDADKSECANS